MDDPYISFADTARLRQRFVDMLANDGKMTIAQATELAASLYRAGMKIVEARSAKPDDRLMDSIAEFGQIPHITQRSISRI